MSLWRCSSSPLFSHPHFLFGSVFSVFSNPGSMGRERVWGGRLWHPAPVSPADFHPALLSTTKAGWKRTANMTLPFPASPLPKIQSEALGTAVGLAAGEGCSLRGVQAHPGADGCFCQVRTNLSLLEDRSVKLGTNF